MFHYSYIVIPLLCAIIAIYIMSVYITNPVIQCYIALCNLISQASFCLLPVVSKIELPLLQEFTFLFLVNFIFGCLLTLSSFLKTLVLFLRYSPLFWYLRELLSGDLSSLVWPTRWTSGSSGLLTFKN